MNILIFIFVTGLVVYLFPLLVTIFMTGAAAIGIFVWGVVSLVWKLISKLVG